MSGLNSLSQSGTHWSRYLVPSLSGIALTSLLTQTVFLRLDTAPTTSTVCFMYWFSQFQFLRSNWQLIQPSLDCEPIFSITEILTVTQPIVGLRRLTERVSKPTLFSKTRPALQPVLGPPVTESPEEVLTHTGVQHLVCYSDRAWGTVFTTTTQADISVGAECFDPAPYY